MLPDRVGYLGGIGEGSLFNLLGVVALEEGDLPDPKPLRFGRGDRRVGLDLGLGPVRSGSGLGLRSGEGLGGFG